MVPEQFPTQNAIYDTMSKKQPFENGVRNNSTSKVRKFVVSKSGNVVRDSLDQTVDMCDDLNSHYSSHQILMEESQNNFNLQFVNNNVHNFNNLSGQKKHDYFTTTNSN